MALQKDVPYQRVHVFLIKETTARFRCVDLSLVIRHVERPACSPLRSSCYYRNSHVVERAHQYNPCRQKCRQSLAVNQHFLTDQISEFNECHI